MDYTIRLEDGVRGVLEEEIKEIHGTNEELNEEDMIDLNLNAEVPEEGIIFDILDESKLAWLWYDRSVGFGAKYRSSHMKHNAVVKKVFACNKKENYKSKGIYHMTLGSWSNRNAQTAVWLFYDAKWNVTKCFLQHNHRISPLKREMMHLRALKEQMKGQMTCAGGIGPSK
ncbi:hypothetical protein Syun_001502 [Stephania yunnanensis]|uniref:FAR1 domain-containing protein n=1 Tax=Stephania yunnanensis TaxID=152371 RepID=A0AAP0LDU7_9MAGN